MEFTEKFSVLHKMYSAELLSSSPATYYHVPQLSFSHVLRSGVTHLGVDRFEICNKLQIPARRNRERKRHVQSYWNTKLLSYLLHGVMLSQKSKISKVGANYNHFRMWHDFSISQVSCKIKIVLENSFMPGSKLLWHTFLSLPNTELFLHFETTLGRSSLGTCLALGTNASSPSEQDVRDHKQNKSWAMLKWVVIREK